MESAQRPRKAHSWPVEGISTGSVQSDTEYDILDADADSTGQGSTHGRTHRPSRVKCLMLHERDWRGEWGPKGRRTDFGQLDSVEQYSGLGPCGRLWLSVSHPQHKTKCARIEFSNEMQIDHVVTQV